MRKDSLFWFWLVIVLCIAAALLGASYRRAQAQNADPAPHERYHQYYQAWRQPGQSGLSCCNANEYDALTGKIHLSGDCEPTHASVIDGHWVARVPQYMIDSGVDEWVQIPDEKIIHEHNPSYEEAHLCGTIYWQEGKRPTIRILCFLPPDTGG